jgi:hypothetical protein
MNLYPLPDVNYGTNTGMIHQRYLFLPTVIRLGTDNTLTNHELTLVCLTVLVSVKLLSVCSDVNSVNLGDIYLVCQKINNK